jgi:hypothetical protein
MEMTTDILDGEILTAAVGDTRKHGKSYIALIVGTDPKYKYKREFLGIGHYEGKRAHTTKVRTRDLQPFCLLEARDPGSWKNDSRDFYVYDRENLWGRGHLFIVSEDDARIALAYILNGTPLPIAGNQGDAAIPGVSHE